MSIEEAAQVNAPLSHRQRRDLRRAAKAAMTSDERAQERERLRAKVEKQAATNAAKRDLRRAASDRLFAGIARPDQAPEPEPRVCPECTEFATHERCRALNRAERAERLKDERRCLGEVEMYATRRKA